ncbi:MAG: anaerobic magnesium-protoporphyrin IX monomethyl ester cyclase [Crocinitomix sp.]|jgi:anaerobic magnesium-protoporphyrin IX monomethyl ester cyclase
MKILFTHSYFLYFDSKQFELSKPYPPLGTITAAAYMREQGYDVALFDTYFSRDPQDVNAELAKHEPEVLVIYDDGFNYLTKMCLTRMREAAFAMIQCAKAKGIHVILASSDSTDHYTEYLEKGADEIILGEGEITLLEVLNTLKNKGAVQDLNGIAFKNGDEITKNPKRPILTDLDSLPIPAWDLIDIEPYREAWSKYGYYSVNLATTRGCPYKCNWCAKPIYGNRYNSRSPQHVVREIQYMQSLFEFDHVWFGDDIFGLKPSWVQEFNQELKKQGVSIRYKIQSRADLLLKDDTIDNLAESGCEEIWIGAESGSQKILDAMDKGTSLAQIIESTRLMKQGGIKPCYFLQFGYLTETWEDIKMTLNLLFEQMPHDIGVSVSYPLPGTKFFDIVKSQLNDKANWEDSDELLLMYKSTYSPEFYKRLHRYIHKRFRQKQAVAQMKKGNFKNFLKWGYFKMTSNYIYTQLLWLKRNSNAETVVMPQAV